MLVATPPAVAVTVRSWTFGADSKSLAAAATPASVSVISPFALIANQPLSFPPVILYVTVSPSASLAATVPITSVVVMFSAYVNA